MEESIIMTILYFKMFTNIKELDNSSLEELIKKVSISSDFNVSQLVFRNNQTGTKQYEYVH